MENTLGSRFKNAWNIFFNRDPTYPYQGPAMISSSRPDRPRFSRGNERSIVTAVYNRIALDISSIDIRHVRLDKNGRYTEDIVSGLNNCLTCEANIDQNHLDFIRDIIISMFDEGCVAVVPVETDINPLNTDSYDIHTMRVGKIVEWRPDRVRVKLYNDRTGLSEEVYILKKNCAILENPLYAVINEYNSTMQRLIRKLNLLDVIDDQSGSGKLDLIIQLPYVIKSDARREQAEKRRKDIEMQLSSTKYGIAYTDGTERITQLNRPVENNLMKQIEYLTSMVYSQLGISQTILDGTADEQTMLNYYNRTIEPILSTIVAEFRRKFLTKTARTQGQSIMFFRNPFKLVPVSQIADISDKLTRNEIASSNEMRQELGWKPSDDPKADELRNKNINQSNEELTPGQEGAPMEDEVPTEDLQQALDDADALDDELDSLESDLDDQDDDDDDEELKHYASEYYDPVKAHEYYMRTRQLKGRNSTAGLNDKGKAAAKQVKDNLDAERKAKVESHRVARDNTLKASSEQRVKEIKAKNEEMKDKVRQIRSQMEGLSKGRRAALYGKIEALRKENARNREAIYEQFRGRDVATRKDFDDKRNALKTEYDAKYAKELERINSSGEFRKPKKTKKKSKTT